jgi:glycosyltransferase involved in cell wall biosynthesis
MSAKSNLLLICRLPPHIIGGNIHSSHLMSGLARRGYSAHALSPIAATVPIDRRQFATTRDIEIQWLELEDMRLNKPNPSSMDEFCQDVRMVEAALPETISQVRPDAIIIGERRLVAGIPDLAHAHGLPCIVMAHSTLGSGIGGNFRDTILALLVDEYRKADLVVAVADHLAAGLRDFGLENVTVIPNSVDTEAFSPGRRPAALQDRLGIDRRDIVVLHASNIVALKRPLDVVAAAEHSLRQNSRLRFVIAGDGPALPAMQSAADHANLSARMHFLGSVDPAEMPSLYRLADIVLMPSETEGLSLAQLEALSSGCVVLASDIPGAREVIIDGETGFLFSVGDVQSMSDLIVRNAEDVPLRSRIGTSARAWCERRPSLDDNVEAFATLIEAVVAPDEGAQLHT